MWKSPLIVCTSFCACALVATAQATVRVEAASLAGPRPLEQQTADAAIRDYLHSWQTLRSALENNSPDLLDTDFVGDAKDKLRKTVQEQNSLAIRSVYRDNTHDLRIVFYSPEGLSIELTDNVECDVQILDHDKSIATRQLRTRYIAVLTPSESRWRVRIFQASPE